MKRLVSALGLGIALMLIALAAWLLLRQTEQPQLAQLRTPGAQSASHTAPVRTGPTQKARARAPSAYAAMKARFLNAKNYPAFIQDAMQRPAEGGRFYAELAYYRCMDIQSWKLDDVTPAAPNFAPRQAAAMIAVRELAERCAAMKDYFPSHLNFRAAMRTLEARQADALLVQVGGSLSAAKGIGQVESARASGDPYLLAAMIEMHADTLGKRMGELHAGGANPILYAAAAAAACEIVGDCVGHRQVQFSCALVGQCEHVDLRDFIVHQVHPDARADYHKTRLALLKAAGR